MVKQSEAVAHANLVGGEETSLHLHPGGGNGGPAERGIATTDAYGTTTVNFVGSYTSKPIVSLTPELPHGTDVVNAQIESWVGDQPPYTGMTIFVGDDGGKPETNVPVHWLIWT